MTTTPAPGHRWHNEVPGTRWFRADLHLHTLDDANVELPPGVTGERDATTTREAYAVRFLDAAIEQGIEILGLTPHAACSSSGVSTTWDIVALWQTGNQPSTGKPYRDLVYAVFPGFEPNFADGSHGIHLLFLFDPSIGKERYLSAFNGLMGGRSAWNGKNLNPIQMGPPDAFRQLDDVKGAAQGNYLTVAAHPLQNNGLLKRPAHRVTDIARGRIQAAELRRDKTLKEDVAKSNRLRFAHKNGVALYHCSDATRLAAAGQSPSERELGFRFALLKMASPTLEALRQALLAHESRLRDPYIRDAEQTLVLGPLPEPCPTGLNARPWLRQLKITGGTSFLRDQTFRFSPDLTCIIGGSMTGKSTLLDGLRFAMQGETGLPPLGSAVRKTVEERARNQFLSGGPRVDLESPVGDLSQLVPQRFPMRFFSQSELKGMADDPEAIEHLLFHLVPGHSTTLLAQRDRLSELDHQLTRLANTLASQQEKVGEAEQAFQRAEQARTAMERFAQAGTGTLPPAQRDVARATEFAQVASDHTEEATALVRALALFDTPTLQEPEIAKTLKREPSISGLITQARQDASATVAVLQQIELRASHLKFTSTTRHQQLLTQVQQALVEDGGSAEDLNAFETYAGAAQHYDSYKAALEGVDAEREKAQTAFQHTWDEREQLIAAHRTAVTTVCTEVDSHFERVRVVIDPEGRRESLHTWVKSLRQAGITRWWNSSAKMSVRASSLNAVLAAIDEGRLAEAKIEAQGLGLSATVADALLESLAPASSRMHLRALRCPDRYRLQWIENDVAKDLDQLSGGRKVAVLLTLLLESDDSTPLVIDQPEDELDNRFLNETIIPALHRLKGKRQVIFATHNANIVVNGDADRVIALEADADAGRVYAEGAIEDSDVREAVLKTLDGGKEAFRLRRAKYGF